MSKVLMIVTAARRLTLANGTQHPTGFWAEELVELHRGLVAAGHEVVIATPAGAPAPVDPLSLQLAGDDATHLAEYLTSISAELDAPLDLAAAQSGAFDAVVLPGGHGPMEDLASDPDAGRLLIDAVDRDAVVAALCHGPAGLLSAIRPNGEFAFAGRRLAVFTDAEEAAGGLGDASPYLVESRLRELGALIESGAPWAETVVVDGRFISGQNPQSSVATAKAVVAALTR